MNKSDITSVDIIELVNKHASSIRLRNCINTAAKYDRLPVRTVGEYLNSGDSIHKEFMQIENMGRKTAIELNNLIDKLLNDELSVFEYSEEEDVGLLAMTLPDFVKRLNLSNRLFNWLKVAEYYNELPYKNIYEYLTDGKKACENIKKIKNIGKKSAEELDGIIQDIFKNKDADYEEILKNNVDSESNLLKIDNKDEMHRGFVNIFQSREYSILYSRAVEEKTLEEIGAEIGVTRERVRQIENKAKRNLKSMLGEKINKLEIELDKLLDEACGEVSAIEINEALDFGVEITKILTYTSSSNLKYKTRYKNSMLYRVYDEDFKDEWNDLIDRVLMSKSWPISIKDIYNELYELPESYVSSYLYNRRNVKVEEGYIISIKLNMEYFVTYALRSVGRPESFSNIARKTNEMFGMDKTGHNVRSILSRMSNALIVGRGVYALYEMLPLTQNQLDDIREKCYEYILQENKYVSSKVLYQSLFNNINYLNLNDYTLLGILQDDMRFVTTRGLMVGLKDFSDRITLKPLTQTVIELVINNSPIKIDEIRRELHDTRRVLAVTINMILEDSPEIVKVGPSMFSSIKHVFGTDDLYLKVQKAIKIILLDGPSSVFGVYKKLQYIDEVSKLNLNKVTIQSVMNKLEFIVNDQSTYRIKSSDEEMNMYHELVIECINSNMEINKIKEKITEKEFPINFKELADLDYKLTPYYYSKGTKQDSNSEIKNILTSFV